MLDYVLYKIDNVEKRMNKQNDINRHLHACDNRGIKYAMLVGVVCIAVSVMLDASREKDIKKQDDKIEELQTRIDELERMKG